MHPLCWIGYAVAVIGGAFMFFWGVGQMVAMFAS